MAEKVKTRALESHKHAAAEKTSRALRLCHPAIHGDKILSGREAWRAFRELIEKKWADGLIAEVERLTGSSRFTYVTAVTKLKGDASVWQDHEPFRDNLRGNPIKILTLQEMLSDLYSKTKTTVASSDVGRLLQVIKASGWKP